MRLEPSAVVKTANPSGMHARADETLQTVFPVFLLNVRNLGVSDRTDGHLLLPLPDTRILSSGNTSIPLTVSNPVLMDCTTAKQPYSIKINKLTFSSTSYTCYGVHFIFPVITAKVQDAT